MAFMKEESDRYARLTFNGDVHEVTDRELPQYIELVTAKFFPRSIVVSIACRGITRIKFPGNILLQLHCTSSHSLTYDYD